jgi:uncharacterized damage-inducible protein DinB
MQSYFATLARYHAWATRRLYEHVDALPEADYRRDAGLITAAITAMGHACPELDLVRMLQTEAAR